jgi:hypothetical protein
MISQGWSALLSSHLYIFFGISIIFAFNPLKAQSKDANLTRGILPNAALGCVAAYCKDNQSLDEKLAGIGATNIRNTSIENVQVTGYTLGGIAYVAIRGTDFEKSFLAQRTYPVGNLQVPGLTFGVHDVWDDLALLPAFFSTPRPPSTRPRKPGCAHSGFNRHALLAKEFVEAYFKDARERGATQLVLTGHSLGGAAATVLASRLEFQLPITLVTFGAPASLGPLTAKEVEERARAGELDIFRFAYYQDPVAHLATGYFFPDQTVVHLNAQNEINAPRRPRDLVPNIGAHAMTGYQDAVEAYLDALGLRVPSLTPGTL